MQTAHLSQHISSRFNADLDRVRSSLLAMGGFVEQQLGAAIGSLVDADAKAAAAVARGDERVNRMELEIDDACLRILATRAPAAGDLRLIVSAIKTITDLERIGDECEKISSIAVRLAGMERPEDRYREVRHLGLLAQTMLHDALDAFARMDAAGAVRVAQRDRLVDEEYETIQRQCVTFMIEDARQIRRALDVMWVVRALERIGDHAKNICEYVVYVAHGEDVRHVRLEDVARALKRRAADGQPA